MRKLPIYIFMIIAIFIHNVSFAQENPLDISDLEEKIEKSGLPNENRVKELEMQSSQLFESGDCAKAVPALEEFQEQSNALANYISAGLKPFYSASHDHKEYFKGVEIKSFRELREFEKKANTWKRKRNAAIVMEAECLAKLGKKTASAVRFVNALRLINIIGADNYDYGPWYRARDGLYNLIDLQ